MTGKGKGCDKGCGKGYPSGGPAHEPLEAPEELESGEDEGTPLDAAPAIPDPPPINMGRALRNSNRTSTRYTRNGVFELLLR